MLLLVARWPERPETRNPDGSIRELDRALASRCRFAVLGVVVADSLQERRDSDMCSPPSFFLSFLSFLFFFLHFVQRLFRSSAVWLELGYGCCRFGSRGALPGGKASAMSSTGDGSGPPPQVSEEEMKKKQEEIRRKKEEIRKRVAIARKQQDLEIAKKQAEQAQKQQNSATDKKEKEKSTPSSSSDDQGVLRIDEGYAHFKILPHDDERGNPNFPYNLHNACELFCRTGNVQCAIQVCAIFRALSVMPVCV